MLEHAASQLTARYASLRPGGGLAPESLAQYFLDLVWLDGVLAGSGWLGGCGGCWGGVVVIGCCDGDWLPLR